MGIAAFLMAEFLGVGYFDVVARGYAPAILYYACVSLSVYLLSVRFRIGEASGLRPVSLTLRDAVNLFAFAVTVLGLVLLMGVANMAPMIAALYIFLCVAPALLTFTAVWLWRQGKTWRSLVTPLGRMIDHFASMTGDLTLLLATLSIMTGALVITGIPTKIGVLLIEAAGVNLALMVLVAFLFGAILGTGLPPAPTYILTALVIAPPMIKFGVDPWVVHFFAFFVAVFGELTPPTSVVAAVTAKIADASFNKTLWRALQLCVCLFMLMAGVFVKPELVVEPGLAQLTAMALIFVATVGVTFAIQATFSDIRGLDIVVRALLGAVALFVLLQPSELLAAAAGVPVLATVGYWMARRRHPLDPEAAAQPAK
jgi:TRAP-type uncharacterized transport system fused permease subunit